MTKSEFVGRLATAVDQFKSSLERTHSIAQDIAKRCDLPVKEGSRSSSVQAIVFLGRMDHVRVVDMIRVIKHIEVAWEEYQGDEAAAMAETTQREFARM